MTQPFAHLHVHSEYSLLDGYSSIKGLVEAAKAAGSPALALTDHGAMYGALDFYKAATDAGVKPIVGCEVYVATRSRHDREATHDRKPYHLVLLAKDATGYANLMQLTTKAHTEGFYYKPRVDRELLQDHRAGLIALSGCLAAEVPRRILEGDEAGAADAARWYRDVFGEDYFLELQDHDMPEQTLANEGAVRLATALGLPLVATNDVHYVSQDDHRGQDLLLCVQTASRVDDPNRMRSATNTFHLRTPAEMAALFGGVPHALQATLDVAERCNLTLDFGRLNLPELAVPPEYDGDYDVWLEHLCNRGLDARGLTQRDAYHDRLRYELNVVKATGFAQYILIVWDVVNWARRQGIVCGPRGSAAGALVLYLLGVSTIDPIAKKLTFERFLNPERVEMPDVDMDFEDGRRGEVVEYVARKYGRDRVAQIITFGTLGARAAIKDVGRATGVDLPTTDRVAKMIPELPVGVTIAQAVERNPLLAREVAASPRVAALVEDAQRVEKVKRHASTHAAGIVIAREPLTDYTPLQKVRNSDALMTQYHADNLAKLGLLKMDFLGLSNLTIIGRTVDLVRARTGEVVDLASIREDDAAAYRLMAEGKTVGLFQLEGRGMTTYLRELNPSSVEDVSAMVALYRPGPLHLIPRYIARKHGREAVEYPIPELAELLEDTYGVLVYQDQVLQVLRKMAGYSLGRADVVRKAMGKKIKELMAKEEADFLAGCRANLYTDEQATLVWNLIAPFAGYGFNRAHAACYARIAYETAYLKAHHPVEFMTSVLNAHQGKPDKVASAVAEARRLGIVVRPPDVNRSGLAFEAQPDGSVLVGLLAVKNLSEASSGELVDRRDERAFVDLPDVVLRCNGSRVNKRHLESLAKAGAFDAWGDRGATLRSLEQVIAAKQKAGRKKDVTKRRSALEELLLAVPEPAFFETWEGASQIDDVLAWEKDVLGVYFTEHPMTRVTAALEDVVTCYCGEVGDEFVGLDVTVAGLVTSARVLRTKQDQEMAILTLEDEYGAVDAVVFPRAFREVYAACHEGAVVVASGRVGLRDDRPQLVVDGLNAAPPERTVPEFDQGSTAGVPGVLVGAGLR